MAPSSVSPCGSSVWFLRVFPPCFTIVLSRRAIPCAVPQCFVSVLPIRLSCGSFLSVFPAGSSVSLSLFRGISRVLAALVAGNGILQRA